MEIVGGPADAERAFDAAARAGGEVLRGRDRVRGAIHRGSAPRRGPGPRRHARQRDPPGRARLHDPAPPPEARRGDAFARRRRRAPRPDRPDRRRRGAGRRIPVGGHGRGAADARGRLLLHGDEHADPGRAHRHGGGHGARPRAGAGARRRGRASVDRPGRRGAPRARDRVPDQRGGRLEGLPAHAGPDHRVSRACRPRGPGRFGDRGGGRGERPLRPDDREADRPRRRPGARHRPHAARAGRVPDRGADRRSSASTGRCSSTPASRAARRATTWSSRKSWRSVRRSSSSRSLIGQQVLQVVRTDRPRRFRASWGWRSTGARTTSGSTSRSRPGLRWPGVGASERAPATERPAMAPW